MTLCCERQRDTRVHIHTWGVTGAATHENAHVRCRRANGIESEHDGGPMHTLCTQKHTALTQSAQAQNTFKHAHAYAFTMQLAAQMGMCNQPTASTIHTQHTRTH
eukprot:GDKI01019676.1.p1 GENE.GDKI01019676.1~~GDKI01019676.1.p1  ORF type:complete len:105 (-),score=24.35 GDKI01019676.1:78-392(-)